MSWSSVRVLGLGVVWLAVQTGCGGNPAVDSSTTGGTTAVSGSGGSDVAGTAGSGATGGLDINPGGGTTDMGGMSGSGGAPSKFVCGNGMLEPGEFCDDGNTTDGDGCSADCQTLDPDYDCSAVGKTCTKVVICGDGTLEGDEVCDDGNTMDMDGCAADCSMVEDGFVCVRPGKPCVPVAVCGDGMRDKGEGCDDGQNPPMSNDGCDDQCQIEPGYYCPTAGKACIKLQCGDGVRTPDEACDDGNIADNDGCSHLCVVEAGFHCNAAGCVPICGDGLVVKGEVCDDGNRDSGDGCSAGCTDEPFFSCSGQPSKCTSTIACGNMMVEPGEVCDPPGKNGCAAGCKSFTPASQVPVCNDGIIQQGEGCEPPSPGNGCDAKCQVEAGWTCPQPGFCFKNPTCGDGTVDTAQGEGCDPPNVGKGCDAKCKVEPGYTCVGFGPSTCFKPVCGDKKVEGTEQCDDGTPGGADDGCLNCTISNGWVCPAAGKSCQPRCGDGQKLGAEECDDGNLKSGDGCNAGCVIEPGFKCPTVGKPCVASVCGDKVKDAGEGCDDGNLVAGDGCGPTCQSEPTVTVGPDPKVNVSCGDGLVTGTEECDDGNKVAGDGCSDTCTFEAGWTCTNKLTLPKTLDMQVKYRDFKGGNALSGDGHPDFQYAYLDHVAGITGVPCTTALNKGQTPPKCGQLDAQGKPVLVDTGDQANTGIMSANTFNLWYRDSNAGNVKNQLGNVIAMKAPFVRALTLTQSGGAASETYVYDSMGNNFYPLDGVAGTFGAIGPEVPHCPAGTGQGDNAIMNQNGTQSCGETCDATCMTHDFSFTTELRYFFQYKGGETLSFTGDDDVWAYVNGRLAVDIGGLHQAKSGQVVLGDDGNNGATTDSDCSAHAITTALPDPAGGCFTAAEKADNTDDRFGLTKGGVYEIVLFHAERHTTASDFKLTLAGFLAPRTSCTSFCGDGVTVGGEFCDDGPNNSNTVAGACRTDCTARNYCGDKLLQTGEQCDDGTNITLYKTAQTPAGACAPGCKNPAFCGDGTLQPGPGELCDLGSVNNTGAYGGCTAQCTLGGYCGDGKKNGPEDCDLGAQNGKTYGPGSCGYDCKPGPHCGDGIPNDASEECDKGDQNGVTGSGCDATCKLIPGCGDGIKQSNLGEQCDFGQFNKAPNLTPYGGCTDMCMIGPHCGDGATDAPYEECDNGAANNDTTYDGCTKSCDLGPRCGDAVVQMDPPANEKCDNGFNNDDYLYTPTSCAVGCKLPPSCGDGNIDAGHELCDAGANNNDNTYDGCKTDCTYGPFCGDGHTDMPQEMCDDGADNVAYAKAKGACGYDCQPAPYCGDAMRNGPEQCDLGTDKNDGSYGACNADCTFAPRCGDGVKNGTEECDDGPTGSLKCSVTCKRRDVVQ